MELKFVWLRVYADEKIINFKFADKDKMVIQLISQTPNTYVIPEQKIVRHFAVAKNVNIKKATEDFEQNKSKGALKMTYLITLEEDDGYYSLFEIKDRDDNVPVLAAFEHLNKRSVDAGTTKKGNVGTETNH